MERTFQNFLIFALVLSLSDGHSYHFGTCPTIEPVQHFQPEKMLGVWYVIQQTNTGRMCITYNFTETDDPQQYHLEQNGIHYMLGLTPIKRKDHSSRDLILPNNSTNGEMIVKYPWYMPGGENYTIFTTDYQTYCGIFTCQRYGFGNRQSTIILSRQKTLDKTYLKQIREKMAFSNIDPFELSDIDQKNCPQEPEPIKIVINTLEKSGQNVQNTISNFTKEMHDKMKEIFETTTVNS